MIGKREKKRCMKRAMKVGRKPPLAGAREDIPRIRVPEFATPTERERMFLKQAGAYVRLQGTNKRVQMLKDLYDDYTRKIIARREEKQALPGLAMDIARMEKERQEIGQQSREAGRKIVLRSPGPEEIWKNFRAGEAVVRKRPSGVLSVSLPVSLNVPFAPDVPDGAPMVVDGTLTGEVWFEDVYVGGVVIPMPLMGIPTDMTEELVLKGLCVRSLCAEGNYTVRMSRRQNLWIMEA